MECDFKAKCIVKFVLFFHVIFTLFFVGSTLGIFYVCYDYLNPFLTIIFIVVFTVLLLKISNMKILYTKGEIKKYYWIICSIIMLVIQIIFAWQLEIIPNNDREVIFKQAVDIVESGRWKTSSEWNYYFLRYPNNRFLLIIKSFWFFIVKLFDVTSYAGADVLLNLVCIDISVFIWLKLIKKIWDVRKSYIAFMFLVLYPPLYTFVPFVYSDSIILPFISSAIYIYYYLTNQIDQTSKQNSNIVRLKNIVLLLLLGINIYISFELKATAFILMIAIVMHLFTTAKIKKALFYSLLIVSVFSLLSYTFKAAVNDAEIFDETDYDTENFPYTHWIMMGLQGNGQYSLSEREFTSAQITREDKREANIEVINTRLHKYGVFGLIKHLWVKNSYTWGVGTYDMNAYLSKRPVKESILGEIIYSSGKLQWLFILYSEITNFILLVGIAASGYFGIKSKKTDFLFMLRIGLFGLAIFLLIWETRPRYLFHFFPLILLISLDGWVKYRAFLRNIF